MGEKDEGKRGEARFVPSSKQKTPLSFFHRYFRLCRGIQGHRLSFGIWDNSSRWPRFSLYRSLPKFKESFCVFNRPLSARS